MNSSVILIKIQWIDLSFFYVCASIQLFMFIFGFLVQKKFLISQILSAALWSLYLILLCFSKNIF